MTTDPDPAIHWRRSVVATAGLLAAMALDGVVGTGGLPSGLGASCWGCWTGRGRSVDGWPSVPPSWGPEWW